MDRDGIFGYITIVILIGIYSEKVEISLLDYSTRGMVRFSVSMGFIISMAIA